MSEISEDLKAAYKHQAEVRKAKSIERGELRLKLEVSGLEAFLELWNSWVVVLGKETATDCLIEAMVVEHELIRARLGYQGEPGRVAWVKVSAPKIHEEIDDEIEPIDAPGTDECEADLGGGARTPE